MSAGAEGGAGRAPDEAPGLDRTVKSKLLDYLSSSPENMGADTHFFGIFYAVTLSS